MRYILGLTFCFVAAVCVCGPLAPAQTPDKVKTIQATIRTEDWRGWASATPIPDTVKQGQLPQKFVRVPPRKHQLPKFSGKILCLRPDQKGEIGVVSMRGVQWSDNDNYEWFPLPDSREFSVTSVNHPEAKKALIVRADGSPWTFLRAEFQPGEGARDIELRARPGLRTIITMEDAQGNDVSSFIAEIFNPYRMSDDQGKELAFQRFGKGTTSSGVMTLDLPPEPVALLLEAGPKIAAYYAVVDAREANHFHFKMLEATRITGTVTRDGKPAVNVIVNALNVAAPMSASARKTDSDGKFDMPGRVPGTEHISVGTYQTEVTLKPGETADLKIDLSNTPSP